MILVSSCLLGIHSKYDGTSSNLQELLMKYSHMGKFLPFCPEQLGGLNTPRFPVEIVGGSAKDVFQEKAHTINNQNQDVTTEFVRGAQETARLVDLFPIKAAILKERSPSCGVHKVYDGSFSSVIIQGRGVTAEILAQQGIPIYSEEELTESILLNLLQAKS